MKNLTAQEEAIYFRNILIKIDSSDKGFSLLPFLGKGQEDLILGSNVGRRSVCVYKYFLLSVVEEL